MATDCEVCLVPEIDAFREVRGAVNHVYRASVTQVVRGTVGRRRCEDKIIYGITGHITHGVGRASELTIDGAPDCHVRSSAGRFDYVLLPRGRTAEEDECGAGSRTIWRSAVGFLNDEVVDIITVEISDSQRLPETPLPGRPPDVEVRLMRSHVESALNYRRPIEYKDAAGNVAGRLSTRGTDGQVDMAIGVEITSCQGSTQVVAWFAPDNAEIHGKAQIDSSV